MVPFGDLINHHNPPHINWGYKIDEENGRKGIFFEAMGSASKGEQVYSSYGVKSNQYILPSYGFIDDYENRKEAYMNLKLKMKKNDPLLVLKLELLGENPVSAYFTMVPSDSALSLFRIAVFDEKGDIAKLIKLKDSYVA